MANQHPDRLGGFWSYLRRMAENAAICIAFILFEWTILIIAERSLISNQDQITKTILAWLKRISAVAVALYYISYVSKEFRDLWIHR